MIRLFKSLKQNYFFILSTSTASLPARSTGHRECFFLFLHVTCSVGKHEGTAVSSAIVRVVDILHVNSDGHPLFDFLPPGSFAPHAKMSETAAAAAKTKATEEVFVFSRDMMYCAEATVYTVPCVLSCRASTQAVQMKAGFETPSGNMHHAGLDLKKFLNDEKKMTTQFVELSLLQCVPHPLSGETSRMSAVIVISFLHGPTLAAVVYHSGASGRRWECQLLLATARTTAEVAPPFVRLVPRAVPCGGGEPICWLQDAAGHWHSLMCRETSDLKSDSRKVKKSPLHSLDSPQRSMQDALGSSNCASGNNGVEEVTVLWDGNDRLFTLAPCC
ncbi:hypothetical protein TraAM80_05608 [Trypanosoma rangeli]|uniref:Uncharacterized protein n=1 Tax=Trypanosoma rangeli TaxID=5698 RepID=A0A422NDI5_TRYRA|nr:uncharacterized protein TraAM80_05608 [Trypanosoma rangeli]RNF03550.1 hypothetical protein TraAM80_05608 [Trypanosoma rangeli]|eukprot:RNF03550.1 hypothetical protein TraAM80_05608 [Trypanosoma rangeli]